MANCRYIRPVMPPRKATGTNTEHRTSTMATRARLTWRIARSAATAGDTPSLAMMRSTFSITTMASSTTIPIASTSPNSVSRLIEKPSTRMPKKAPMTETGTASTGMSVARQLCRKTNTTSVTSSMASNSVFTTSWIEAGMYGGVSNATDQWTPAGGRRGRGLAPDAPGGVRGVLLLYRGGDVPDGEPELRHAVGVEAQEHRELELAHGLRIADAWNPLQLVLEVDLRVVAQVLGIEPRVVGGERAHHEDRGLALPHGDPVAHDLLRQLRFRERDLVLHVHRREVRVARHVEVDRQVHDAVARVRRLEVEQPLEPQQLLFDRRGDRRGDVLRRRAGVHGLHLDLGGRERREIGRASCRERV